MIFLLKSDLHTRRLEKNMFHSRSLIESTVIQRACLCEKTVDLISKKEGPVYFFESVSKWNFSRNIYNFLGTMMKFTQMFTQ